MNREQSLAMSNRVFTNPVQPDIETIEGRLGIDQGGYALGDSAGSDLYNTDLADAGRVCVGRFHVDGVEG